MAKTPYTNTSPTKIEVCGMAFLPGDTKNVDEEHAKILEAVDPTGRRHPLRAAFRPKLTKGIVEMPPAADFSPRDSLMDLEEPIALAQIKLCTNPDQLATWFSRETRENIKMAMTARGYALTKK